MGVEKRLFIIKYSTLINITLSQNWTLQYPQRGCSFYTSILLVLLTLINLCVMSQQKMFSAQFWMVKVFTGKLQYSCNLNLNHKFKWVCSTENAFMPIKHNNSVSTPDSRPASANHSCSLHHAVWTIKVKSFSLEVNLHPLFGPTLDLVQL